MWSIIFGRFSLYANEICEELEDAERASIGMQGVCVCICIKWKLLWTTGLQNSYYFLIFFYAMFEKKHRNVHHYILVLFRISVFITLVCQKKKEKKNEFVGLVLPLMIFHGCLPNAFLNA